MGIAHRLVQLFRVKPDNALGHAEDPWEVLDCAYSRQMEMLAGVRRGVADVTSSRRRLDVQLGRLRQAADRLKTQAGHAVAADRDGKAREVLTLRAAVLAQITAISAQRDSLQAEEDRLTAAVQRLRVQIEAFRARKETLEAIRTAAEAQTRIGEKAVGISEETADVGQAVRRADDRTTLMQARAALDAGSGAAEVERELAARKAWTAVAASAVPAGDTTGRGTLPGARPTTETVS